MDRSELLRKRTDFLFPAVSHYYQEPLVLTHGKGSHLYDIDGRAYLDFFGGVLTVSVGHCNEEVTARVARQVQTL